MTREPYTCESCGETFVPEWTEEEAAAEAKELWGIENIKDRSSVAVVCDDCFGRFMVWRKSLAGREN